jgi:transcriptional regulator of acetoin/glycerol metabolism
MTNTLRLKVAPQVPSEDEPRGTRLHRLTVVHPMPDGSEPGPRSVELGRNPVRIGRTGFVPGPLAFDDPRMSREHALLAWDEARSSYVVHDLSSHNGLFVDGARVDRAVLGDQSVLRLGSTLLVFDDCELHDDRWSPASVSLGRSRGMRRVQKEIEMVGPSATSVLLLGEAGVGKEHVARELHAASHRKGPLVTVDCGALLESTAERELFGQVGATGASPGRLAAAQGGTLFLDEIGALPLALQPALLEALATKRVRPVGGTQDVPLDLRVVASTSQDLAAAVQTGTLDAGLRARLGAWMLRIPSLRERKEDLLALARTFARAAGHGGDLTADAAEELLVHRWPSNVRELERAIVAARLRVGDGAIRRRDLAFAMPAVADRGEDEEAPLPVARRSAAA